MSKVMNAITWLKEDLEMELTDEHYSEFLVVEEEITALQSAMKKKDDALDALIKAASENQSELILLTCLDSAGVDNWEGYDFAFEVMKEHYPAEYERRFGEVT